MLSLNLLVVNIMSEEDANVRRDIAQLCNMFSLFCAKPLLTYTQESTGKIILQWIKVKLAVHGISEQNGIRDACSTADCCPLLSIVAHCSPFLPICVHCCPLLGGTQKLQRNDVFCKMLIPQNMIGPCERRPLKVKIYRSTVSTDGFHTKSISEQQS